MTGRLGRVPRRVYVNKRYSISTQPRSNTPKQFSLFFVCSNPKPIPITHRIESTFRQCYLVKIRFYRLYSYPIMLLEQMVYVLYQKWLSFNSNNLIAFFCQCNGILPTTGP